MKKASLLFLVFILAVCSAASQEKDKSIPKKIYTTNTIGTEKPPIINGVLDDAAWNVVDWGGDFVEWRPDDLWVTVLVLF